MNHPKPGRDEGGEHTTPNQPETNRPITPKIYVASLADYNDGRLHGAWIDANQEAEAIHAATQSMLKSSPLAHREYPPEEWAIHDFEGFHHFRLNEHTPIGTVAIIASGINEHGAAFAHWADVLDDLTIELLDQFEDHYEGEWNTMADYAKHYIVDCGFDTRLVESTPMWLLNHTHIDYAGLGADLSHHVIASHDRTTNTVHVFTEPDEPSRREN